MSGAQLRFDIFSLFPKMFSTPFAESIVRRAIDSERVRIDIHDIRLWSRDRHRTVDDRPYGGGPGMVMMAPPIVDAVESVFGPEIDTVELLLMSPRGTRMSQPLVRSLASERRIGIVCGHYEGVDERVLDLLPIQEVSIGDYVLTGGELPAMVVVDAVTRLLPGVLQEASTRDESHEGDTLEHPHYTRPAEYRGMTVPEVLLSGHHENVKTWRRESSKRVDRD